jgi:hypothetical protein
VIAQIFLGLVLFMLVAPPLQPGVARSFPSMGYLVPQPFAARGNQLYLEFWAITGGPWYPVYITSIVAPEPSVEWVARADHSTVARTGTHMVLWALPWDSVVRLQG